MLIELLVTLGLALIFLYFGLLIWKKQKVSLIHYYHYKKVKDEDMKAYTTQIGQGLIVIGIGCGFTGAFNYLTKSAGGWVGFGLALFYGLSIVFKAQKKYNGGLF